MPHFFINSKNVDAGIAIIDDNENYKHIAKSLRAKIGEKILLIDENRIQYEGLIKNICKNMIEVDIKKSYKSNRDLGFNLYLAQTPLRSDAQNMIIEKATELGVRGIYPIWTDNCALKKEIILNKIEKWQKIMMEASKQCERSNTPKCFDLSSLEKVVKLQKFDKVIACCERSIELTLKKYLKLNPIKSRENVLLIVGPEGGFSSREFDFFKKQCMIGVTLGDLILKAETAVVVAVGNLVYEFENN